jgi:hypothetical protein
MIASGFRKRPYWEVRMRYKLELDQDRKDAGWGLHYWIVDTLENKPLRLLPEQQAIAEMDRLNDVPSEPVAIGRSQTNKGP